MTRAELRILFSDFFCGCGNPDAAGALIRDVLALAPFYESQEELEKLLPTSGIFYLVLYQLDRMGLIEHGGSVGGSWLTGKGEDALKGLRREGDLRELFDGDYCIHGIDDTNGSEDHDCMTAPEPSLPYDRYGTRIK